MTTDLSDKVLEFQQNGDSSLGKEIFSQAYLWANMIINKEFSNAGYYDDFFSEAHDAIVDAIKSYKKGNSKFSSYCSLCIRNSLKNLVRSICNKNKAIDRIKNQSVTFNAMSTLDIKEYLMSLKENQLETLLNGHCKHVCFRAKKKFLSKTHYGRNFSKTNRK